MQNKQWSIIESITNTTTGYFLNIITQILVLPLFNVDVTIRDNFMIGAIFFLVSFSRNYIMRRIFTKIKKKA